MVTLPTIISDLAIILLMAGITMLVCKKLNQPLVLGYIIAGFITGPNFIFFPTIADIANINIWAEIGVIFLLFALGLEFSFMKLKNAGKTAFIAAFAELFAFIILGVLCGKFWGMSMTEGLVLGSMLVMSSTTIVIKAFDDLNLRGKTFTDIVFSILIIEDIIGIILMVILSTVASSNGDALSGFVLAEGILKLFFFLILWFVMGMYLVPTFYKQTKNFMNDEMLLVVSIGLCLGMVVLCTSMGFSAALGAFIMGSLIAETPNAEKIERIVKPVKDLFGAIFFVSVGMMVNPSILIEQIIPIFMLILTIVVGKLIFTSGGIFLAGKKLEIAMKSGFSMAQIGEFSFIVAGIGINAGLLENYIYPVVVAVSVITTFMTPIFIKLAEPCYNKLIMLLPASWLSWINRYTSDLQNDDDKDTDWLNYLKYYLVQLMVHITFLVAICLFANYYLLPLLQQKISSPYNNLLTALVTILLLAPFLRMLLGGRGSHTELFTMLWFKKRSNHLPLIFLLVMKLFLAVIFIYFVFYSILSLNMFVAIVLTAIVAWIIGVSDWLLEKYLKMEARFLVNLNAKHMKKHKELINCQGNNCIVEALDESLVIAKYLVPPTSPYINKELKELNFRAIYGFNILQMQTKAGLVDLPGGTSKLLPNSTLLLIGTRAQIKTFEVDKRNGTNSALQIGEIVTLREYMLQEENSKVSKEQRFLSCVISINSSSPLRGKSLKGYDVRKNWECLVVALERDGYSIINPNVSLSFEKDDLLWVIGKQKMINHLIREEIL